MHKILTVARREYVSTVRRKSFLIITFAMPLFFMLLMGLSAGGAMLAARSSASSEKPVGIVDEVGILKPQLLERVRLSFRSEKSA